MVEAGKVVAAGKNAAAITVVAAIKVAAVGKEGFSDKGCCSQAIRPKAGSPLLVCNTPVENSAPEVRNISPLYILYMCSNFIDCVTIHSFADTPTIISSLLSRQASTTSTAAVPRQQVLTSGAAAAAALPTSFVAIAPAKQQVSYVTTIREMLLSCCTFLIKSNVQIRVHIK